MFAKDGGGLSQNQRVACNVLSVGIISKDCNLPPSGGLHKPPHLCLGLSTLEKEEPQLPVCFRHKLPSPSTFVLTYSFPFTAPASQNLAHQTIARTTTLHLPFVLC